MLRFTFPLAESCKNTFIHTFPTKKHSPLLCMYMQAVDVLDDGWKLSIFVNNAYPCPCLGLQYMA